MLIGVRSLECWRDNGASAPLIHPAILTALPGYRPRVDWCPLFICLLYGPTGKGIKFKNKLIFKLDFFERVGYFEVGRDSTNI